jgi:sugar lactone lactonase YvrE
VFATVEYSGCNASDNLTAPFLKIQPFVAGETFMHKKDLFQFSVNARRIASILGWSCLGALSVAGGGAQAAATLTSAAVADGYTLSTFVSGIPASGFCCGPVGVMNTTGGNIMIADYGIGQVSVFSDTNGQTWGAGTPAATAYGTNNVAGLASFGGNLYATRQSTGQVITIDAAGNQTGVIASISGATGIIGSTATGQLYVSTGGNIFSVDPTSHAVATFVSGGAGGAADGLSLSADGSILYAANNGAGHIYGFNTTTHAMVFDSGFIAGGVDGTAFGAGGLAGNLFVNTNGGTLVKVNLTTLAQTVLVTGGSRGDFVWVDSNTGNPNDGTLLFTQTDSVLRLTAPAGGGFVGNVPEPETYAMLIAGLGMLGFTARRRKHKAA